MLSLPSRSAVARVPVYGTRKSLNPALLRLEKEALQLHQPAGWLNFRTNLVLLAPPSAATRKFHIFHRPGLRKHVISELFHPHFKVFILPLLFPFATTRKFYILNIAALLRHRPPVSTPLFAFPFLKTGEMPHLAPFRVEKGLRLRSRDDSLVLSGAPARARTPIQL